MFLKWLNITQPAVFLALCIVCAFQIYPAQAKTDASFEIVHIEASISDNTLLYTISGKSTPVYTVSESFSPFKVVIDIAGGSHGEDASSAKAEIPQNGFSNLNIIELKNRQPPVMRFEFMVADSHDYSVDKTETGLKIGIFPVDAGNTSTVAKKLPIPLSLEDLKVSSTPNTTTITVVSNTTIGNYTVDTMGGGDGSTPNMYIDIEDVRVNELVREKHIGTSVEKIRVTSRGDGARIFFDSAQPKLFRYTVTPSSEGLSVIVDESRPLRSTKKSKDTASSSSDRTLNRLIDLSEQLLPPPHTTTADTNASKTKALKNDFSLSGYAKQRISVDFYKIDIHNVFRLLREITDINIIIDEDVRGSLTLALDDVPWDFALDIILNLMHLKKEERFNTIIIYPSQKAFVWPTRVEDNLDFEANLEVIEQEALVIEKSASQPKEIMQAKEFMVKGQRLEKQEKFEDATLSYNKALELWPSNGKISNKLAAIYLVNLGMNSKAVHYAKKSLASNSQNNNAALYAAIGSANMQRIAEAKEYFRRSIVGSPPLKEALISYAAFSENIGQNEAALKLLDKYHFHYGESVDSMVAKARVLDKLGLAKEATKQYKAILNSGFQLRPDLKQYIKGRLVVKAIY